MKLLENKCKLPISVLHVLSAFTMFLIVFVSGCKQEPDKNRQDDKVKSSNTNVTSITIGKESLNLENEDEQMFYVDEELPEPELLSSIKLVSEDGKAKLKIEGETEDVFVAKPHEEKKYTLTVVAENGKKGKSWNVKMIRFIIDKTIPIAKPEAPFSSNLSFDSLEDFWVLGKSRTVDYDAYEIAKYEVTYKLWKEIYDWAVQKDYKFAWTPPPASTINDADLLKPIQDTTWGDAVIWCNAYSEYKKEKGKDFSPLYVNKTSKEVIKDSTDWEVFKEVEMLTGKQGVRLPTELEWEVAARGGSPQAMDWAYRFAGVNEQSMLGDYAWYVANAGGTYHRVGEKKPNSLKLYDMSGNVGEFCFDCGGWLSSHPLGQNITLVNPIGFDVPQIPMRTERGSKFDKNPILLQTHSRQNVTSVLAPEGTGFRFVIAKNDRPFTNETLPVHCDVESIKVADKTYSKPEFTGLEGAKIEVETNQTTIMVNYPNASDKAKVKLSSELIFTFTSGIATVPVDLAGYKNDIKLIISDFGKKKLEFDFTIINKNAPSCDVDIIKVGSQTFTKGTNLDSLKNATINVDKAEVTIEVTYNVASKDAKLKVNSMVPVTFVNKVASLKFDAKLKTNKVKLTVSDEGKKDAEWEFTIANNNGQDSGGPTPPPPPPPPPPPGP